MLDSRNVVQRVSKAQFEAQEPELRGALIDAQFDLLESGDFPVIVLLSGMNALGRSAAAQRLSSWMDPRHVHSFAELRPNTEERDRPRMWRFWRALPPRGSIGVFLSSWYEGPTVEYLLGRIKRAQFKAHIDEIARFERMLAQDGTLILKFMFLLPEGEYKRSLRKFENRRAAAWKISEAELEIARQLKSRPDHSRKVIEQLISATSTEHAPWIPLASADKRHRDLTIGRTLVNAINDGLAAAPPKRNKAAAPATSRNADTNILDMLDLDKSLDDDDYQRQLKKQKRRLTRLTLKRKFEKRALVAVFEGNDAAGKGGSIRRVVQALDPRTTSVIPIAAPSDEDKAHPYLWRFWRHIPKKGHVAIFDRCWYGRVLVERVERLCTRDEWMRAYDEIRSFEAELADYGVIVMKFWLAIDKAEQLRRFKERESTGYKRYKITDEDWRNRRKWKAYAEAVHDMVDRTSTPNAPWTLVEANDKYFARVKVLKSINDRLKAEL